MCGINPKYTQNTANPSEKGSFMTQTYNTLIVSKGGVYETANSD
jgi:hypothetical protein